MKVFLKSCVGALFGLSIGLIICYFAGESPFKILKVLFMSSFGSGYDFGMTLFYTAPLVLTGIAVALPFRAGLFNIGAEGQLTMGALAAAWAGVVGENLPSKLIAVSFATLLAFLAGGIWGAVPGLMKAKRGSHEVITTIMMNFIAAGISSYVLLYVIKDPNSTQPESIPIAPIFHLRPFAIFNGAPMGGLIFMLIGMSIALYFILKNSVWGYELSAIGENEVAAETYGISKQKAWFSSMFVAGGMAGLVGIVEILGNSHQFRIGFSPEYGFIGIAVALVARGNFLGLLPAALLFGILQKGSASLDLETEKVTRDLSYIIQGLIILGVSLDGIWDAFKAKRRRRAHV